MPRVTSAGRAVDDDTAGPAGDTAGSTVVDLDSTAEGAWDQPAGSVPAPQDAPTPPRPHRAQHGPSTRRRRWLLLLAAAPVVGIALAAAFAHHTQIAASPEAALNDQLAAIRLGKVRAATPATQDPDHDAQGRLLVQLWVTVVNAGDQPARLQIEGISGDYAALAGTPSSTRVEPGASSVLSLAVAADCAALPPSRSTAASSGENASPSSGQDPIQAPESWLVLRLTPDSDEGLSRSWRYDTPPGYSLPDVIDRQCAKS